MKAGNAGANFVVRLKRNLQEDQLDLPKSMAIDTLAELTRSLMSTQAALLRASNADKFAEALAALHATFTEEERMIAALVAITRDRNA